ncbi:hypothetical protein KSP40_PGU020923 [Platanthera guangdongensis]|uniref:Uncharacterized protein n=1 Tax=Platanthera guangdongensis TaxID=2320717 RepID=A0ABR2M1L1_9ASPA
MLGSIPTSTSSSGWLDRLRTSKGFPIPSHLDLDHFLHSNFELNPNPTPPEGAAPPASNSPVHQTKQQSHKPTGHEKEQRLFDLMNNVLSELFVMGDPRESATGRKSARKQMNPRVCSTSASASASQRQAPAVSPSSADNSVAEGKRGRRKMKRMRESAVEAAGSDPLLNTGTVVTVIDTSSPGWKSERHFRKGMSWKGKEKKMWNVCRKKRKVGLLEKLIVEKEPLKELKGREQNDNVKSHIDVWSAGID